MNLTKEQNNAIWSILHSNKKQHFINGAAGVGKSFTTLSLIDQAQKMGKTVITTATSHAARANLKTKNHTEFNDGLKDFHPVTIQSLLAILPGTQNLAVKSKDDMNLSTSIKKNVTIDECADILIIDEVSMMGMSMYKRLMYNQENFGKIVYIGDMNQLPPVLDETVNWGEIAEVHKLTKVLRTENEEITRLANAFLNGEDPDISHLEVGADHFKNNDETSKIILAFKNKRVDKYITEIDVNDEIYRAGVPCIAHQTVKYGLVGDGDIDVLFNGEPFNLGNETKYNYDEVQDYVESLGAEGIFLRNPKNAKWSELFQGVKLFKIESQPDLPFVYLFDGTKEEYLDREWYFTKAFIDVRDRLFKKYNVPVPKKPSMVSTMAQKHFTYNEMIEFREVWGQWISFGKTVLYARPAIASTVHKFQGLGVNEVYINPKGMDGRMLYTAITRARNKVYFIKKDG